MSTTRPRSWFATLRRDRGPFALVGCLLLLFNILQPLAAAQAGEGGHMALCAASAFDERAGGAGAPGVMAESCPVCLIGNACPSAAPAYKATLAADPAFPARAALAGTVEADPPPAPARRPGAPPPAIRAPPPSA